MLDGHWEEEVSPSATVCFPCQAMVFPLSSPCSTHSFSTQETTEQLTSPIPSSHGVMAKGTPCQKLPQHFLRELFSEVRYLPVNTLPGISSGWFLAMSEVRHSPITASLGTSEADSQPVLLVGHHADFSAIQQATTAHFPTRSDFSAGGRSLGALSQPWGSRLLLIYTIPMLCGVFFW